MCPLPLVMKSPITSRPEQYQRLHRWSHLRQHMSRHRGTIVGREGHSTGESPAAGKSADPSPRPETWASAPLRHLQSQKREEKVEAIKSRAPPNGVWERRRIAWYLPDRDSRLQIRYESIAASPATVQQQNQISHVPCCRKNFIGHGNQPFGILDGEIEHQTCGHTSYWKGWVSPE
jgi:hypothetical protein